MIGQESDEAVLAYLRERGPCTMSLKALAAGACLPRVTTRVSVASLSVAGHVCLITNAEESVYRIRHLHAEVGHGACEESLAFTINEYRQ